MGIISVIFLSLGNFGSSTPSTLGVLSTFKLRLEPSLGFTTSLSEKLFGREAAVNGIVILLIVVNRRSQHLSLSMDFGQAFVAAVRQVGVRVEVSGY
jgi:hypothetical protein